MLEIIHLIMAGGIFMYAILAASLVAVAVILQRLFTLWVLYRIDVEGLRDRVLSYIDQGQFGQAAQLCEGSLRGRSGTGGASSGQPGPLRPPDQCFFHAQLCAHGWL